MCFFYLNCTQQCQGPPNTNFVGLTTISAKEKRKKWTIPYQSDENFEQQQNQKQMTRNKQLKDLTNKRITINE